MSNALEFIILLFLVILGLFSLALFFYAVYLILRNFPKFLKAHKKSRASSKEELLYYSENKEVKKFMVALLISIYLFAIVRILGVYFFPDLGAGDISEEFRRSSFTLGLLLAIMAYSMIPIYLVIRIALRETLLEKVPFPLVVGLPGIFPVVSVYIYEITGNILFSLGLIVTGVIFNIMAFKYRDLGGEKVYTHPADLDAARMIEGLSVYIMDIEPLRPPISLGVTPYSFKNIYKMFLKLKSRFYFIRNSDLNRETREKIDPYFHDTIRSSRESILFFFLFFIMIFIVALIGVLLFYVLLDLNELLSTILSLILGVPVIYLILAWKITKIRNICGEKHDDILKTAIQSMIDTGRQCMRENGLKPQKFPISLKHNDYEGLEYGHRDRNGYTAFFILNQADSGDMVLQDHRHRGYLVCDKCGGYYQLKEDESPGDFAQCQCGGSLKYFKNINWLFDDKE